MHNQSFINGRHVLFLCSCLAFFQSGCQLNPADTSDPGQQQEKVVILEVAAEPKPDLYSVTVVDQGENVISIYYERAQGSTIYLKLPLDGLFTVKIDAYVDKSLTTTGTITVPSEQAGLIKVAMLPLPPTAPTNVTVNATSSSSTTITWTAAKGATSYIVYGDTSSSSLLPLDTVADTNYSRTGLSPATTCYYEISAVNAGGESSRSATVSMTMAAATPTGVTATAVSSSSISVTWTAVTGATGYIVFGGASSSSLLPLDTITEAGFSHTGLPPATTCCYAVASVNGGGASAPSATVSSATKSDLATPAGVTATAASSSSITVTWTAVAGATGYIVSGGTSSSSLQPIDTITQTGFSHTALLPATVYFYAVAATNAGGVSSLSSTVNAATKVLPPATPTGLTAVASSSSSIAVTWTAVAGATTYIVFGGASSSSLAPLDTVNEAIFSHTGLSPATTWYYATMAVNAGGQSPRSATVTATTKSLTLTTPTGVTAAASSSTSITVTWTAVTGATSYIVMGGTSASSLSQIGTPAATTFTHTGLVSGTTYYYSVVASSTGGSSALSSPVNATTNQVPPVTPTDVSATTASSSSITVAWTAVTGATGYIVYGGASSSSLSQIGTPTTATFSHTGLTSGTTYYYAVAASNASGASARSTTVNATTTSVAVAPATPTGVTATAVSSSSITVTWTAVTGATSYIVYGGASASSLAQIGTSATANYSHTGLSAQTTCYYTVAASNTSGTSVRSTPVVSATTQSGGNPNPAAPIYPTGVTATAISSSLINLTWSPVTGKNDVSTLTMWTEGSTNEKVRGYNRLMVVMVMGEHSGDFSATGVTYGGQSMTRNVDKMFSNGGNRTYSAIFTLKEAGVNAASSGTINVAWSSNPSGGYTILSVLLCNVDQTTPIGAFQSNGLVATTVSTPPLNTSSGDMVIAAGSTENVGSITFNNGFTEMYETPGQQWGDACCGYKMGSGASETPSFSHSASMRLVLCAIVAKKSSDNTVSTSPATRYIVYGGTSSASLLKLGEVIGTVSYSHTGLTPWTMYYYSIAAANASGESERSGVVSATTKGVFGTPQFVVATAAKDAAIIKLTWPAVPDATKYTVYGGTSAASLAQVGTSTTPTFLHKGLQTSTTYYYGLTASSATATSGRSPTVSATTPATVIQKAFFVGCHECWKCIPCPHGAISNNFIVDPMKCVGKTACGKCLAVCPYGTNVVKYQNY